MNQISFVIYGNPYSKSNRRILTRSGLFIKSKEAIEYEKSFKSQCPKLENLLEGYLAVEAYCWYRSHRSDLDISLILDCMQGLIYKNDNKVKIHSLYSWIDKDKPKVLLKITKIPKSWMEKKMEKKSWNYFLS